MSKHHSLVCSIAAPGLPQPPPLTLASMTYCMHVLLARHGQHHVTAYVRLVPVALHCGTNMPASIVIRIVAARVRKSTSCTQVVLSAQLVRMHTCMEQHRAAQSSSVAACMQPNQACSIEPRTHLQRYCRGGARRSGYIGACYYWKTAVPLLYLRL